MRPVLELHSSIAAAACVESLLFQPEMRKATKFLGEKVVVKATRKQKLDRRVRQETFLVTIGRPNYGERVFIKQCRRAGEPIPVRKVQLKRWPKKRER